MDETYCSIIVIRRLLPPDRPTGDGTGDKRIRSAPVSRAHRVITAPRVVVGRFATTRAVQYLFSRVRAQPTVEKPPCLRRQRRRHGDRGMLGVHTPPESLKELV